MSISESTVLRFVPWGLSAFFFRVPPVYFFWGCCGVYLGACRCPARDPLVFPVRDPFGVPFRTPSVAVRASSVSRSGHLWCAVRDLFGVPFGTHSVSYIGGPFFSILIGTLLTRRSGPLRCHVRTPSASRLDHFGLSFGISFWYRNRNPFNISFGASSVSRSDPFSVPFGPVRFSVPGLFGGIFIIRRFSVSPSGPVLFPICVLLGVRS